jgi:hypothetical protein
VSTRQVYPAPSLGRDSICDGCGSPVGQFRRRETIGGRSIRGRYVIKAKFTHVPTVGLVLLCPRCRQLAREGRKDL